MNRQLKADPFRKKTLVITGPEASGKSFLSRFFIESLPESDVVTFCGRFYKPNNETYFSGITADTKVILLDEVNKLEDLKFFISLSKSGINVHRKMHPSLFIDPNFQMIIISLLPFEEVLEATKEFHSLCHYVDLKQCGYTNGLQSTVQTISQDKEEN